MTYTAIPLETLFADTTADRSDYITRNGVHIPHEQFCERLAMLLTMQPRKQSTVPAAA